MVISILFWVLAVTQVVVAVEAMFGCNLTVTTDGEASAFLHLTACHAWFVILYLFRCSCNAIYISRFIGMLLRLLQPLHALHKRLQIGCTHRY